MKAKAADAQVRVKEQQLLIAEQQLKLTREMLQREAHAAHIARQSALHHSNCLQIEYSTRKGAEEKASSIEAEKRRLELDLAEAESSLKRKQSETECASSSSYQPQSVNDTTTKVKYEEQEKGSEKTHKQKRNEGQWRSTSRTAYVMLRCDASSSNGDCCRGTVAYGHALSTLQGIVAEGLLPTGTPSARSRGDSGFPMVASATREPRSQDDCWLTTVGFGHA